MNRLAVVVPAFQGGASIASVVREVFAVDPGAQVIVVDDGSEDATAQEARGAGARVVRHPFNCGIGAAVQAGLGAALAGEHELFVRIDADGQHDAAELAGDRYFKRRFGSFSASDIGTFCQIQRGLPEG